MSAGIRYCTSCGSMIDEVSRFCSVCGAKVVTVAGAAPAAPGYPPDMPPPAAPAAAASYAVPPPGWPPTAGRVGFSARISDPSFDRYRKKSGRWSILFAVILAVIAVIAFPIYGNVSGELEMPTSLFYGMGIGGLFILIALLQLLRRGMDTTWDGVVSDKKTYTESDRDENSTTYHTVYRLKVQKDSGGTKTHRWRDSPGLYHYYNIGDRVRHHKGFAYYEKYDKSRDTQIVCAACLTVNDIGGEVCSRCKCPLLK